MVNYVKRDITGNINRKPIYGSPLLAILKTISISKNLLIIANEKNPKNYKRLIYYIDHYRKNGMPIFVLNSPEIKIKNLKTNRKHKLKISKKLKKIIKRKKEKIYPTSPNEKPPIDYKKIYI
ncbi:MAG: hypothetical protein P8Y97_09090, partial [Candidatus Lokiarchaeota archaeon]